MLPASQAQYSLRPYRATDRDAVLDVFRSNTPDFFAVGEVDAFAAFLSTPESECLVATTGGGEVIGFGAAYNRSGMEGGLAWGMVRRTWHRHGVGKALLETRIARLWALAVTQIRVHTSQHSAGFFARAGFTVVAVAPDGYAPGIDEVTMILHRPDAGA